MTPTIEATRYTVYPDGYDVDSPDPDVLDWVIGIERRSLGYWAVTDGANVYTREGKPTYEPLPSARTEKFKKQTRFRLDTAQEVAIRVSEARRFHGMTWTEFVAWREAQR